MTIVPYRPINRSIMRRDHAAAPRAASRSASPPRTRSRRPSPTSSSTRSPSAAPRPRPARATSSTSSAARSSPRVSRQLLEALTRAPCPASDVPRWLPRACSGDSTGVPPPATGASSSSRGVPTTAPMPAEGRRGGFVDAAGHERFWAWSCPVCGAQGCGACAAGHGCTRAFPLCFVHRLPMVLSQCWCCGDQMTGLSCPACVGGACARCWREDCRPGAPRCRPAT
jgi:hypothetical protein